MVAGEGSRDQHEARAMAYRDPAALQGIVDAIADQTIEYLRGQIDAGAEAVQLFDSWSGSLAPDEFERWVIAPNAAIVAALGESHPETPVIGFPKGAGEKLPAYARETGVRAVGVDETLDPAWVARELPAGIPVQGNLDPLLLLSGSDALEARIRTILDAFADRPHVFNLGHGIDRRTPIGHVERLIAAVRGFEG
jgi:uroporphyrinogen decarboxylase